MTLNSKKLFRNRSGDNSALLFAEALDKSREASMAEHRVRSEEECTVQLPLLKNNASASSG